MTEDEIQGLARRWDADFRFSAAMDEWTHGDRDEKPISPAESHGIAPLADVERDALFDWVRLRMSAYSLGARVMGIEWSDADECDREDMADWISQDLGEDIHCGPLCDAAGWPS
jgi:hypothetical protein